MAQYLIVGCRRAVTDGQAQEFRKQIEAPTREAAEAEARETFERIYQEILVLAPSAPKAWLESAKLELISVMEVL